MKAEELRIGNFVGIKETALHSNGCNHLEAVFEVEILNKSVVGFKGFHSGEWYTDLKPIPITEKWLVRFGFEEDGVNWYYLARKDRFTDIGYAYNTKTNIIEFNEWGFSGINYVHQLQNLYFALTGKELNYEKATQN